jgi:hypothetical protein
VPIAAGRTGHGGYLFGRKFALFHADTFAITPSRESVQFGHCEAIVVDFSREKIKGPTRHWGKKRCAAHSVDQVGELWNVFLGDGLEFQAEAIRLAPDDDAVKTDLTFCHEEMDMN